MQRQGAINVASVTPPASATKANKCNGGASWTDKLNGGGGKGPPMQEHQCTPSTHETSVTPDPPLMCGPSTRH